MPVEITARKKPFRQRLRRDMRENRVVYLLLLPVIIWYIVFCYLPMFGIVMAFENFKFAKGLSAARGSDSGISRNSFPAIISGACCVTP